MAFIKGKTPGATYTQLVAIKDPSTGDYTLARDPGTGTAEKIPVWVQLDSAEALKVLNTSGETIFKVDSINSAGVVQKLTITGNVTNTTDATTKAYVDSQAGKPVEFKLFEGSEGAVHSNGKKFSLTGVANLINGSVQVTVNGVYYLSNTNQTTVSEDFHISGGDVIFHDTNNGGTLDLIDDDSIGIYYQTTD